MLRNRNVIISTIKYRIKKITHKYVINTPVNAKYASNIEDKNQNRFWKDTTEEEMNNDGIIFGILKNNTPPP